MSTKGVDAIAFLEKLDGPLTFAGAISSIRMCDEISQAAFARRLGISRQNLCDIEKGRATVSPERAARWANMLGYNVAVLVGLALQGQVDAAGLGMKVSLTSMRKRPGPRGKPRAA